MESRLRVGQEVTLVAKIVRIEKEGDDFRIVLSVGNEPIYLNVLESEMDK
jgi:hypothetical protein